VGVGVVARRGVVAMTGTLTPSAAVRIISGDERLQPAGCR
jgi:hypothetical protein